MIDLMASAGDARRLAAISALLHDARIRGASEFTGRGGRWSLSLERIGYDHCRHRTVLPFVRYWRYPWVPCELLVEPLEGVVGMIAADAGDLVVEISCDRSRGLRVATDLCEVCLDVASSTYVRVLDQGPPEARRGTVDLFRRVVNWPEVVSVLQEPVAQVHANQTTPADATRRCAPGVAADPQGR